MSILYGALMVLALAGMIVCSKKQKGNPAMQPVAFVLFLVVIICAGLLLKEMGVFGLGGNSSILNREMKFYSSQGFATGRYLASIKGGQKVLILADQGYQNSSHLAKLVDAFKSGYGSDNVVVTSFDLTEEQKDAGEPLYMIMKAKDYDAILEQNSDCKIVISLVGLPSDSKKMKIWSQTGDDRQVIFLMSLPDEQISNLDKLIKAGSVAGVIISNPQAKYDVEPPKDPAEAFKIRYVLVNQDNVEEYKDRLTN